MKRLGFGLALLHTVLLGSLALVLSADAQPFKAWPNDQLGRPAPPCMIYDTTTGNVVPCTATNPIPTAGSGAGTGTTTGTSLTGFGKAWYPSTITGSNAAGEGMIPVWVDTQTVAFFRRSTGCGNCLQVAVSQDGGVTGTFFSTTAVLGNSIGAAHRVPAATPRYLVSSIGGPFNAFQAPTFTGTWTAIVGLANPVSSWASNANGSVVLSSDSAGQVCKSTNGGVSFSNCVAAASGQLTFAGGTTWLLAQNGTANVLRSTNDGATWGVVFAVGGGNSTSPICLSPTYSTCLVGSTGGTVTRSTDSGATWPLIVDTGLGGVSIPALCDYGNGVAAVINVRSAPVGFAQITTDAHATFNSGLGWFPGNRFGSAWDGTGTPGGAIACHSSGRAAISINVSGGGQQVFAEYNPLTAPGGTLQSSAGGYVVAASIQGGIILNTTPTTSAANTAAAVTLTNTAGSRICIRSINILASAAGNATLTVADGATTVLNLGTLALGIGATRIEGSPVVCSQTNNNLVVNVGAAGAGITTTTSVISDRYPN